MVKIERALISVFYKDGLEEIVRSLHKNGVEIVSTGGTAGFIEKLGIPVTSVESLTGFPPILGGRVKTLHPAIFGGILNRSDNTQDQQEMQAHQIPDIDLVIVDLYPFEETLASTDNEADIIEKIDIGGVSLIRAAAKNFNDTLIVAHKDDYGLLLTLLNSKNGHSDQADRRRFAAKAFEVTAMYDRAISNYFSDIRDVALRYGENPHQKGKFVGQMEDVFTQLHGKALSYNNLLDIDAAIALAGDLRELDGVPFAILKHNNACGLAIRNNVATAYKDAMAGDPVSAFGGILISGATIDKQAAEAMADLFFEVLIAPDFDSDALELLKVKKNRILLKLNDYPSPATTKRSVLNGILIQDRDRHVEKKGDLQTVTAKQPTAQEIKDLLFANVIVKHTKSNAIVLAKNGQLLASGTGQTSRVDALRQAIEKAGNFGMDLQGAVMASDAFFPFPDCVEIADEAGITAVIQPGGSINDKLSIDYCNANNMSMAVTGIRHFKH